MNVSDTQLYSHSASVSHIADSNLSHCYGNEAAESYVPSLLAVILNTLIMCFVYICANRIRRPVTMHCAVCVAPNC